jgi:hypothetical protein
MGASNGWSQEADGGVVRIWELMTGVSIAASAKPPISDFKPREYPKLPPRRLSTRFHQYTQEMSLILFAMKSTTIRPP